MAKRNSHQNALLGSIGLATLALFVPVLQQLLLPLTYLNTHIHELCHAVVAVVTGGQVQSIVVNADGSGLTWTAGGNELLISSAGYLGATALGGAIILLGSNIQRARATMGGLAGILALSMLIWVRGDIVGVVSGFAWIFALALAAFYLRGNAALFACQFLGAEQCFSSISSVYQLLQISVAGDVHSDAQNMQAHTMIPAMVWAGLWCLISLATVGFTARLAWKRER